MDKNAKPFDSLFWKSEYTQVSKAEFEAWSTPEMTGRRMLDLVTIWLTDAVDRIEEQHKPDWQIDFHRPDWINPENPEHVIHELERMTINLSGINKAYWASQVDADTRQAMEIIKAVRSAVQSLRGVDPRQAVKILETVLHCSLTVAKAHTKPWERKAEHRLGVNTDAGIKGGEAKREQAQPRIEKAKEHWDRLQVPERERAGIIANKMGVSRDTVGRWRRQGWKLKNNKADTS